MDISKGMHLFFCIRERLWPPAKVVFHMLPQIMLELCSSLICPHVSLVACRWVDAAICQQYGIASCATDAWNQNGGGKFSFKIDKSGTACPKAALHGNQLVVHANMLWLK